MSCFDLIPTKHFFFSSVALLLLLLALLILHPFPFAQISSSAASRSSSPSALAAHSRRHHQHRSGMIIKHIISCSTKRKESSDRCFVSTSCRFPLSHRYNTLARVLSLCLSASCSLTHSLDDGQHFSPLRRRFASRVYFSLSSLLFGAYFISSIILFLSHTSHITISTAPSLLLSPLAAAVTAAPLPPPLMMPHTASERAHTTPK